MPRKPRQFINGEIYHLVMRRIENELLFGDIDDYYRGIFYIYECNTTAPITIRERRRLRKQFKKSIQLIEINRGLTHDNLYRGQTPVRSVKIGEMVVPVDNRDLMVEVLCFCLMPNHIHLLVRQLKAHGISKFIQKIASGYAAYFKSKYGIKIRGYFFLDRFSAIHIKTDKQLRVVVTYIHTNPAVLVEPGWKEKGVEDTEKVIKFLEEYKWSSYQDYLGKKNFPSVTERKFVHEVIGGKEGCQKWVENWVKYKGKVKRAIGQFSSMFLEK